jgi:acyl carrier protein
VDKLSEEEILVLMKGILAENQQDGEGVFLAPEASLDDCGIDSLRLVLLFSMMEMRAKIRWGGEDLDPTRYETIASLAGFLYRQQGDALTG